MKKLILIYFLVCSLAFAKTLEIKIAKSPAGTENYIKLLLEKSLKQMGMMPKLLSLMMKWDLKEVWKHWLPTK